MRNEVKSILEKLQALEAKVQGFLDNTESEERQESLENELEAIQGAIESLENIE